MLPLRAASMSPSVGCGFAFRSATAARICPDWQKPHCTTSSSAHAFCTGRSPARLRPSIVVMDFPTTDAAGLTHERTGSPSTSTVQAPHCAMPHPNLVPVSPSASRSAQRSGVSSGIATSWTLPLTVSFIRSPRGAKCRSTSLRTSLQSGRLFGAIHVVRQAFILDDPDLAGVLPEEVARAAVAAGGRQPRKPRPREDRGDADRPGVARRRCEGRRRLPGLDEASEVPGRERRLIAEDDERPRAGGIEVPKAGRERTAHALVEILRTDAADFEAADRFLDGIRVVARHEEGIARRRLEREARGAPHEWLARDLEELLGGSEPP